MDKADWKEIRRIAIVCIENLLTLQFFKVHFSL